MGDDLAGVGRKLLEDCPLLGREMKLLAFPCHAAVDEVDRERTGLTLRAAALCLDAMAECCAHAGKELGHAEGLGDVVVGTCIEGLHLACLGVADGEDEQRHVGKRTDLGDERETVAVGQAEVEEDQIGLAKPNRPHAFGRVHGLERGVALGLEC